jgi:hypothetical protein
MRCGPSKVEQQSQVLINAVKQSMLTEIHYVHFLMSFDPILTSDFAEV